MRQSFCGRRIVPMFPIHVQSPSSHTTRAWVVSIMVTSFRAITAAEPRAQSSTATIFCFLFDVAVTNMYILHNNFCAGSRYKTIKDFRLRLTGAHRRVLQSTETWTYSICHSYHPIVPLPSEDHHQFWVSRPQTRAMLPLSSCQYILVLPGVGFGTMATRPGTAFCSGTYDGSSHSRMHEYLALLSVIYDHLHYQGTYWHTKQCQEIQAHMWTSIGTCSALLR